MKIFQRLMLMTVGTLFLAATNPHLHAQGTAVFYQPAQPIPLLPSGSPSSYDLDVDANGFADYRFTFGQNVFAVQPLGENRLVAGLLFPPPNIGSYAARLPPANPGWFEVGSSLAPGYSWVGQTAGESWLSAYWDTASVGFFAGQAGWMGIEFRDGTTAVHYGAVWIDNSIEIPGGYLRRWMYESRPGEPLWVWVPEPSTWSLLAAGVAGLWFLRRRR